MSFLDFLRDKGNKETPPPQTNTNPIAGVSFSKPESVPVVPEIVTASDVLANAYDPSKLHPLAGIGDKLDYLLLDDDKLSTLPGGATALPSRGWSDDLCYGTGTTYLAGIGGLWGLREGAARPLAVSNARLRLNSILNGVTRRGTFLGNSAGVLALIYNAVNSTIDSVRGKHDIWGGMAAGGICGALYKSTAVQPSLAFRVSIVRLLSKSEAIPTILRPPLLKKSLRQSSLRLQVPKPRNRERISIRGLTHSATTQAQAPLPSPTANVPFLSVSRRSTSGSKGYQLVILQEPTAGAAHGSQYLSRVPLAPALIIRLDVLDPSQRRLQVYGPLILGKNDDEIPFFVCTIQLLDENALPVRDPPDEPSSASAQPSAQRLLYGSLVSSPRQYQDRGQISAGDQFNPFA
ncbi:Mitochondrial import inner membrane translocase subunit tim23 [Serendipita indica DSM 11827]|nr:Mitochondrial import inner membrane translocase subunit tim23 [Serendipita indica DSM 11827]